MFHAYIKFCETIFPVYKKYTEVRATFQQNSIKYLIAFTRNLTKKLQPVKLENKL